MADSIPLIRQWRLLQMLSSRRYGVTVKEIASEYNVTARTVTRDLNLLKSVGFPITEQVSAHGLKHWKLNSDTGLGQLQLTFEEVAALYLGRQFHEAFAGTLFWEGSQQAYQKIRAVLNDQVIAYLEKMASTVYTTHLKYADYTPRAELIDDLMVAIEDRQLAVITYQSLRSTEPVTFYDLHPYVLVFHKGALYLVAYSLDHGEVRTFKIDRISEVNIPGGVLKFTIPEDFDIKNYLAHSFGIFGGGGKPRKVRVRFSSQVVRILEEKQFHPSQILSPQPDGSIIAEYSLNSLEEFRSWVLSFGRHAKVLTPTSLSESIRQEVEAMREMYGSLNSFSFSEKDTR